MITINVIEVLAVIGLGTVVAGIAYGWVKLGEYLKRKEQERLWK